MGGVVSGIGGAIGGLFGKGGSSQRRSADQLQQEAYNRIKDIKLPTTAELRIDPQDINYYAVTGKLTPQMEIAIQQDPTIFDKINQDPQLYAAQLNTLQKMMQVSKEGLTVEDRARIYDAQDAMSRAQRSGAASALESARERGMGGSNAALMAALQGGAGAESAAAKSGFDIGTEANRRALDAVTKSGDLARQMSADKLNTAMGKAQAKSGIEQFNILNRREVQRANIAGDLLKQQDLLGEQRRTADANTQLKNQLLQYKNNLILGDYERNRDQANALAGAAGKYANYQSQRAAEEDLAAVRKGSAIGGIIGGGLDLAKGMYGGMSGGGGGGEFTGGGGGSGGFNLLGGKKLV